MMSMMQMKKIPAIIALVFIIGVPIVLPLISRAAVDANGNPVAYHSPSLWPAGYWGQGGLVSCTGNYIDGAAQCTNLCDLVDTIINVIYFVMTIAIFIVTPIMFLVGAVMLMVSGANPEMMGRGKKILTGTFIGLAIVLGSYLIVQTAVTVIGINGVGGFNVAICSTSS